MMAEWYQGDIIKISGFKKPFMIVSNNAFIHATNVFHVCPVFNGMAAGPLHICVKGIKGTEGTVLCEQIKLIDPQARNCQRLDRLPDSAVMDISDALQGILEYD